MDGAKPPVALAMALAALLAGCATPDAPPAEPLPETWVIPDPVAVVDGTFEWHEPTAPANAVRFSGQAVAHPCLWDGTGTREPYFTNLRLPTDSTRLPPWSGNLTVVLDWSDTDWVGTSLRIAYRPPASSSWEESEPFGRGEALTIPIRHEPADGNATTDDADPDSLPTGWAIWACLPSDTGSPELPFWGSLTARAEWASDPMPAALLEAAGQPGGRVARPGP